MTALDWSIVVVYLIGLVTLSYHLGKGQANPIKGEDSRHSVVASVKNLSNCAYHF